MLTAGNVKKIKKAAGGDDQLPLVFSALSDARRFQVFKILILAGKRGEEVCVTDIANILGTSVPAASRQLRILEMSGIARRERAGQMTCYKLNTANPLVKSLVKLLHAKRSTTA